MPAAVVGGLAVDLRRAFRPVASSVWVVTTALDGQPAGFTAISVSSVSLDPPLLSFNIGLTSSTLPTLQRAGRFAVHLLDGDQQSVADRFAADASQRFADPAQWQWCGDGLPSLNGAVTRLNCLLESLVPAGDSLVALGLVQHTTTRPGRPLVHQPATLRPERTSVPARDAHPQPAGVH